MDISNNQFQVKGSLKKVCITFMVIGLIALLISFKIDPYVGWTDFLVNTLYVVSISSIGVLFMSMTGIMQLSWTAPFKRITESMSSFLVFGFVLMLITYFGQHYLYDWTHPGAVQSDPVLIQKAGYLNVPFFMIRMVLIFAIWIGAASILKKRSLDQDTHGWTPESIHQDVKISVLSLVGFTFACCFAAFDWIMTIEPHWFSTMFGVYFFAGAFVSAFAFITLAVFKLQDWGYLKDVISDNNLHDLGKFMFGFSIFWAYIWFCQYLLIWYANIAEETEYYVLREEMFGKASIFINAVFNFMIPFLLLMTREAKRSRKRLTIVAVIILIGHFYDLYLMVSPKVFHSGHSSLTGYGILQLLELFGFFGFFILVFSRSLSKHKLVATNDPNLLEGVHLHQ